MSEPERNPEQPIPQSDQPNQQAVQNITALPTPREQEEIAPTTIENDPLITGGQPQPTEHPDNLTEVTNLASQNPIEIENRQAQILAPTTIAPEVGQQVAITESIPIPTQDDKRVAAIAAITLSGQLITASLAMITIEGAFFTFIVDKSSINIGFYLLAITIFICFIVSVVLGGKGINEVYKRGYGGVWDPTSETNSFNYQAFFNIAGLILFTLLCIFSAFPKDNKTEEQIKTLNELMKHSNMREQILRQKIEDQKQQLETQKQKLQEHQKNIQEINNFIEKENKLQNRN